MKTFLVAITMCTTTAFGAIPQSTTDALKLPFKNRLKRLKAHPNALEDLHKIAKNGENSLQMRWRAITSMGQLFPSKSVLYLQQYAQSPQWYLRNAAILAFALADREVALYWAERLLEDKALVVRTAAVQTIKKIEGYELKSKLWETLNSKQNFHRGQSLWIRKYIAELLYKFALEGEESMFVKLLLDKDERLHPYAIKALQKLTRKRLAKGKPVKERRQAWLQYFKNKDIY